MIETIGTNAGLLWHALDESERALTVKELQKVSGIRTQDDVRLALGWLAKEGKVSFDGEGRDYTVALVR